MSSSSSQSNRDRIDFIGDMCVMYIVRSAKPCITMCDKFILFYFTFLLFSFEISLLPAIFRRIGAFGALCIVTLRCFPNRNARMSFHTHSRTHTHTAQKRCFFHQTSNAKITPLIFFSNGFFERA